MNRRLEWIIVGTILFPVCNRLCVCVMRLHLLPPLFSSSSCKHAKISFHVVQSLDWLVAAAVHTDCGRRLSSGRAIKWPLAWFSLYNEQLNVLISRNCGRFSIWKLMNVLHSTRVLIIFPSNVSADGRVCAKSRQTKQKLMKSFQIKFDSIKMFV